MSSSNFRTRVRNRGTGNNRRGQQSRILHRQFNSYNNISDSAEAAALSCFTNFTETGQEFFTLCNTFSNMTESYCVIHQTDFDCSDRCGGGIITCSRGHSICGDCADQYVYENSSERVELMDLQKRKGLIYCPLHKISEVNGNSTLFCCDAQPYDMRVLKANVNSGTYERLLTSISRFEEQEEFERLVKAFMSDSGSKKKNNANTMLHFERYLLTEQLSRTIVDPRQCKACDFGPVEPINCDNLRQHHGQVYGYTSEGKEIKINNCCPLCGWFSSNRNDWPIWNREKSVISTRDNPIFIIGAYLKRLKLKNISFPELAKPIENSFNRIDRYFSNLTNLGRLLTFLGIFMLSLTVLQASGIPLLQYYSFLNKCFIASTIFLAENKLARVFEIIAVVVSYIDLFINYQSYRNKSQLHNLIPVFMVALLLGFLKPTIDIIGLLNGFHNWSFRIFQFPINTFAPILSFFALKPLKFIISCLTLLIFKIFEYFGLKTLALGSLFSLMFLVESKFREKEYADFVNSMRKNDKRKEPH